MDGCVCITRMCVYIHTDWNKEKLFLDKLQIWVFIGYPRNTDDDGFGDVEKIFFWGWGRERVKQMQNQNNKIQVYLGKVDTFWGSQL